MLKWTSFGLYVLVGGFYYFIWSDVSSDAILAYAAVRDATILGIFVALALIAILSYGWKGYEERGRPYTPVSIWFFYISILLGTYNFGRLFTVTSVKDGIINGYLGTVWKTGLLGSFQHAALIFGIVLIAVEFLLYHRKRK